MTSSRESRHPNDILSEVLFLLSENEVRRRIDQPLDAIFNERLNGDAEGYPSTNREFLGYVGGLMRRIQHRGQQDSGECALGETQGKAVSLLEQYYGGFEGNGYAGALADMTLHGKPAAELVEKTLLEGVKAEMRKQYVKWVLITRVSALGWRERRDLAAHILNEWRDMLPEDVLRRTPEELEPLCQELILSNAIAMDTLDQVLAG